MAEIEDPREVLTDVTGGERLKLTLSSGEELTGEVSDVDTTDYPGEHRLKCVAFVTGGGEWTYDISVNLDRASAAPSVSRTTFADVAADLGRIPEDEVDDPDEYITLDEGHVARAERGGRP